MTDYLKIWQSINEESAGKTEKTQIARRVFAADDFHIFLATDFDRKLRLLYIESLPEYPVDITALPVLRGLEVSYVTTTIGECKNHGFLRFTQSIPETDNIFESVISDVCERVALSASRKSLQSVLISVLGEWKYFFEKPQNELLSISEQKGLIGELIFLEDYMFSKYDYLRALQCWTGPDFTNHDFQNGSKAFEIKATSSKQHKKFSVSSEKQLDSKGLEHLYLVLFSFNIHENRQVDTLPARIEKITSLLKGDPIALYQFGIKVSKYGYNANFRNEYKHSFSLSSVQTYAVVAGFPGIFPEMLPAGVGDIKYTVAVAACKQFEVEMTLLNLI